MCGFDTPEVKDAPVYKNIDDVERFSSDERKRRRRKTAQAQGLDSTVLTGPAAGSTQKKTALG